MKVIICGGGHVGLSIAQYLEGEYDITLIDASPTVLADISEKVDAQAILGNAADPDILEKAGAHEADIIVAVTGLDEINIVTCQMAHTLFNVSLKIARLRNTFYTTGSSLDAYRRVHLPIDVMISPEEEVAAAISRHLQVPFAFDVFDVASGRLKILGVTLPPKSLLFFTPLHQFEKIFPDLQLTVLRILRGKDVLIPREEDALLPGDAVYFLLPQDQLEQFIEALGLKDEQSQRLLIIGGGRVGMRLALEIERNHPTISSTLIEYNKSQTHHLVSQLSNTLVLNGDALDNQILQEAGVEFVDTVVSVTNDDKVNILSSLLAKRHGARRAVTLVSRQDYMSLMVSLGIDKTLSPSHLTISLILQRVRKEYIRHTHSLGERIGEVMEIELHPTAHSVGLEISDVNARKDMQVTVIVRKGDILFPSSSSLVLQAKDLLIVTTTRNGYKQLKRFFAPRIDSDRQA